MTIKNPRFQEAITEVMYLTKEAAEAALIVSDFTGKNEIINIHIKNVVATAIAANDAAAHLDETVEVFIKQSKNYT